MTSCTSWKVTQHPTSMWLLLPSIFSRLEWLSNDLAWTQFTSSQPVALRLSFCMSVCQSYTFLVPSLHCLVHSVIIGFNHRNKCRWIYIRQVLARASLFFFPEDGDSTFIRNINEHTGSSLVSNCFPRHLYKTSENHAFCKISRFGNLQMFRRMCSLIYITITMA